MSCRRSTQRHFVCDLDYFNPRRTHWYEEATNPVLSICPDDGDIRDRSICDPCFIAVNNPVGSIGSREGFHLDRIGSNIWFSKGERTNQFTSRHTRQPGLALLLGAEGMNRMHSQRPLNADERTNSGITGLKFLTDKSVVNR